MNKTRLLIAALGTLAFASTSLHAQDGCFHSPEAPTDVLMLVGAVGMFYGSSAVRKLIGRRRKR